MQKKLRILHLEDIESDADLVKRELNRANLSFELLWVADEASYSKALTEFHPDIVLSDYSLPGFNAEGALKMLSENRIDIPFILITATISDEFAVKILKTGAEDYILKDRMQRLPAAVLGAIEKHNAEQQSRADHESLRKSEANLMAIIENSDSYIHSLDVNLNYVFFNTPLKNIMKEKYGVEITTGMKVIGFLGPHEAKEMSSWEHIYKTVLNGNVQQFVKDYSTPMKSAYISFSIHPIYENGTIIGVSSMAKDITVQYQAEEEKAAMVEQLIKQNNDLIQFSFIASHNMRGPVASMLGLVNLFNIDDVTGDSAALLPHLKTSAEQLDGVIRDISETLSIRTGETHARELVGLNASVKDIDELVSAQLSGCRGTIVTDNFETTFLTIKSYFHNILYNLITNAIKFRDPARKLRIAVHAFQTEGSSGFTIMDNGLGIDLDKHGAKIFGLYHRFHAEVDGRGLGLFITKIQVEALNGTIDIESVIGEGTHFKINFSRGPDGKSLTHH